MAAGEGMGLKQVTADPVLAIACHVAAHAVAGILLGIPFVGAEIGAGRAAGRGRLAVDSMPFSAAEDHMACAMGGAAFDALLRPTPPLLSILARSSRCGFCAATWQPMSVCFGDAGWNDGKRIMPAFLRSKGLVRASWDTVANVGRELAGRGRWHSTRFWRPPPARSRRALLVASRKEGEAQVQGQGKTSGTMSTPPASTGTPASTGLPTPWWTQGTGTECKWSPWRPGPWTPATAGFCP